MRLIIEARLGVNDIEPTVVPTPLAVIDRYDDDFEQLGLSLAEGRELLAAAQSVGVSSQASRWIATQDYCHKCYTSLRRKDSRPIVMRTVFGKVSVNSPRFCALSTTDVENGFFVKLMSACRFQSPPQARSVLSECRFPADVA